MGAIRGYTHEVVQRILAAKDEGLVREKAFHELRMALPENARSYFPPLSVILEERRNQNKEIKVVPIPEVNMRTLWFYVYTVFLREKHKNSLQFDIFSLQVVGFHDNDCFCYCVVTMIPK